jgi:alpha-mannosidase
MKKNFAAFFLFYSFTFLLQAQTKWINGFAERNEGENLDYHSCHPDANLALLIRCFNDKDYIEWKTDTIPSNYKDESVTFAWIAGYSVGTSSAPHKFYLYMNDHLLFEFDTAPGQEQKDWQVTSEDGSTLYFKFINVDSVDDFFGYMILTIPAKLLDGLNYARIKVKGDATDSKDWYMTMQYPLVPKTRITPQKIIAKDSLGNLMQQVKVSIDHFDAPEAVNITSGKNNISSELKLGMNDFYLNYIPPKTSTEININITADGITKSYSVTINPAREITFYLIPHAHVDIGYTDLQTNVERKHWNNFEKAIEYSKKSITYGSDAVFKWNVEVLWAVKSYLENFPEKKEEFFKAVKNGWIGLDANYSNVMTALCRPEELYRLVEYSNELERETGIKIESSMISDIPGYTWGIVQAFADNGIKYFSVGTNEFDRIGNTLKTWGDKPFYWLSPSGKEKILIWLAGKGYSWFHHWRLTRDDISPIAKYLDDLDECNYPYDIVHVRYNIGGDNGFPDSTLSEFVRQWNDTHVTPKFKIATNTQMFKDFEAKYSGIIPTLSGDFTPYWEDGAGSTAKETALNRNSAELLNQLEILYTLFNKDNFPEKEFNEAWKYVLLFSEHTWGAWNSISDPEIEFVTGQWEIKKSYAMKADSIAQMLLQKLTNSNETNKPVDNLYVCNSSSWTRSDVVKIPKDKLTGASIVDEEGNQVPSQKLSNGDLVFLAKNIPPFGFKEYKILKSENEDVKTSPLNNYTLSNNNYTLSFNEKNYAINFLGRTGDNFNYVDASGYKLNEFIHTGKNGENPITNNSAEITGYENGPVLKSVIIKSEAKGCINLLQEIILFNNLDKIEMINTVDKKKDYNKESIRFAFPFNIKNPLSQVDLAWSVIEPERDQLAGSNKNYFTAQRWVDISGNSKGLTFATIDAPFIELGGMNAEDWMSSPDKEWYLNTSSSSLCYSWAMNNSWHTNFKASQEGVSTFKYSLRVHEQFDYLSAYKFGIESSQPLHIIYGDNIIKEYSPVVGLDSATSLVVTTMKPSEDKNSLIIRIFNPTDKTNSSYLSWVGMNKPVFFLSSGDEEEKEEIGNKITLNPFEAVTLKIREK